MEVWYYDSGNIPKGFLEENFLWDLGSQGYRKAANGGFGYFQDLDKMVEAIKENNLSLNLVHAYFYDAQNKRITNNTGEIKRKVATFSGLRK